MTRAIIIVLAAMAIITGVAYLFRANLTQLYMSYLLEPSDSFAETTPPAAPDYSQPDAWAALPDKADNADVLPNAAVADRQEFAPADVFFIHPTTYYSGNSWNQPLHDATANQITDSGVLRGQASVFNSCCKVYAPRYRQATLFSFMDQKGDGKQALELAYGDVKASFEYFLRHYNRGRPFILASHSQGSFHGVRLLEDYFSGKPLLDRLIAAYLVGGPMVDEHLQKTADIPVCNTALQNRCQLTWNTVGKQSTDGLGYGDSVCVNPLNWQANDGYVDHSHNLGGVLFRDDGKQRPDPDIAVADGQCVNGQLQISSPIEDYINTLMGPNSYHIFDYALFHMNIRQNAQARTDALIGRRITASNDNPSTVPTAPK
jgi:hypothetical protein|tara:strand:- start:2105 stop:3226 length:1122 start_codon:yes stop_codon:yes gene_type:complete